jgi:hypothetical protein
MESLVVYRRPGLKPINIPPATVEAHGGAHVNVSAPLDFEFSDGNKPIPFEGMRIGDTVYTLIGIENDGELEALKRTRCFYLGFFSGQIPIFTVRVADVMFGEPVEDEVLPVIPDNFELWQDARSNWDTIMNGDIAIKQIEKKSRFIQKVGTDAQHRDVFMEGVIDAGQYLMHSFLLGETMIVPKEWLDFLYGSITRSESQLEPEVEELHSPAEETERVREEDQGL